MAADMDKTIFVISPIGGDDSPQRKAANQLLEHVITPVAEDMGYEVQRADKIVEPGTISTQIIQYLVEAPIVVADMTGHNPNVFYELAVRHAAKKPVIHMITNGETIPFDVAPQRAIMYTLDLDGAKAAREALKDMAAAIEAGGEEPDSPLTNALIRINLAQSGEPQKELDSKILGILEDVRLRIANIENAGLALPTPPRLNTLGFTASVERGYMDTMVFLAWLKTFTQTTLVGHNDDLFQNALLQCLSTLDGLMERLMVMGLLSDTDLNRLRYSSPAYVQLRAALLDKIETAIDPKS